MTQLTIDNFKTMLTTALANIKAREDEFSKLDAVIGDGDHGQAIVTLLPEREEVNIGPFLIRRNRFSVPSDFVLKRHPALGRHLHEMALFG